MVASVFWPRVTNTAFTVAVLAAFIAFVTVRFDLVPIHDVAHYGFEIISIIGAGVILGLMVFAFTNAKLGAVVGVIVAFLVAPYFWDFVRDYAALYAVTVSYGVSTILCVGISLLSDQHYDFNRINELVKNFHEE